MLSKVLSGILTIRLLALSGVCYYDERICIKWKGLSICAMQNLILEFNESNLQGNFIPLTVFIL